MKLTRWQLTAGLMTLVGLGVSVYLAWIKITQQEAFCSNIGDCEAVNTSIYSEIAGIPIALLGAGAYLAILVILFMERRAGFWQENGILALFGLTLAGVIYSAYLTYIEVAVLRAICPYCVVSAVMMLGLFLLTTIRLIQGQAVTT